MVLPATFGTDLAHFCALTAPVLILWTALSALSMLISIRLKNASVILIGRDISVKITPELVIVYVQEDVSALRM